MKRLLLLMAITIACSKQSQPIEKTYSMKPEKMNPAHRRGGVILSGAKDLRREALCAGDPSRVRMTHGSLRRRMATAVEVTV